MKHWRPLVQRKSAEWCHRCCVTFDQSMLFVEFDMNGPMGRYVRICQVCVLQMVAALAQKTEREARKGRT